MEGWVTYAEAAKLLGMSPEAVRQRARRQRWPTRRDNEQNKPTTIQIPDSLSVRPGVQPPVQPPARPPVQPGQDDALLVELRRRAEGAEARAGAAETRMRELAGELADAAQRRGRAEGERDATLAVAARLQDDVVRERERADAALERALAAEARLEAGNPAARAAKVLRTFLGRLRRP